MKFFIVDAFTDNIFGGNPAGVAVLDKGEDFPPYGLMVKTAAELRYSETVFIKQAGKVTYEMRYFTPTEEVDLCGHATIGAFTALTAKPVMKLSGKKYYGCGCYHKYDDVGEKKFKAVTKAGELDIEVNNGTVFMDMGQAESLGGIPDEASLYEIMGTKPGGGSDGALKPEIISTGLPDIIMPLEDTETLDSMSPDFEKLTVLSRELDVTGVHAFCFAKDGSLHARNFAPSVGIDEEAATGTASGALTYYLLKHGHIEKGRENMIIQGESMGRPSRIVTRVTDKNTEDINAATGTEKDASADRLRIQVGGSGVIVAEGTLFL